jgi:hypothetical protein
LSILHPTFSSTTRAPTTLPQQPYLNVFLRWGIVLVTTMTLISSSYDEDKVFYNYRLEDLILS